MGVSYLSISAVCTLLSFVGLQYWTELSLEKLKSDGLVGGHSVESVNARHALQLLFGSQATIALLANFALNVFVLLILGLKTLFFVELYPSETRKLVERLINYVIYKGTFLPMIVPPTVFQVGLWSTWLTILCSLKDKAMSSDIQNIRIVYVSVVIFEPLSIAFETLQAIVIHGFQLLDIWLHDSAGNNINCQRSKLLDISAAGSFCEWKGILIRNLGFLLDIMTLLMALCHYVHIWWLHGMKFHLVDAVLFLNIRALLGAIVKHIKGFIRLKIALGALHGALPDTTPEEIEAYDDECAICREPMAKAKRLSCKHLFHLACLRSWLDQGLSENYSCPTCRKPLHMGRPEDEANPRAADVSTNEQLARQINSALELHNHPDQTLPTGVFPNQIQNPLESGALRGAGLDSSWLQTWSRQGLDGAGPSTGTRSAGLGRVQMMMRHLAAVGETYAQTTLEDTAWSLWPMNPSQAGTSNSTLPPAGSVGYPGSAGGLHMRSTSRVANDNIANVLAMAETVREVLPHIPDELIFQDLQRTNSVTVTVNNLLQM
ncbi:E3 ubiquitin protein ligase RIN2 [Camellia lanceoleosa]|uniref:E3 ubiquitin protein ligase RIN2 n=1 Tax=Camellia lanceoleosa TaxID=1840588 RepID=A0ACC0H378_9ERIC|nr:E3 ubiquitin protein ligase RIN2 [Camellia lanceoleosa]